MTESAPEALLPSGLSAVRTAVEETGAAGFVHVGGQCDAGSRYLTRLDGPDRETAVVFVPADDSRDPQAVYCVPRAVVADVAAFEQIDDNTGINRHVAGRTPTTATGQQVCSVLADRLGETADATLLVPRGLPHDTAVFLQAAGYELQSTPAVTTARGSKTSAERDCLRTVQEAATTGIARAEAVLAASEVANEGLRFDGRPLSAVHLCRLIDTELVSAGVSPAANTSVETDTEPSDLLPAGEPIRLGVAPRGPHGYYGQLTRTVAVDSEGGWERRAYIAAEAGIQAAIHHAEAGENVSTVQGEAVAEVGAYGFAVGPDAADSTLPWATASVHGVGLSTYEQPAPGGRSELYPGSVLAVETGVVDPTRGELRLGTLLTVSEEGAETVVEYPYSLTPADRLDSEPE